MALRVNVTGKMIISQDDATNPSQPTFSSGALSYTNTADFSFSSGDTIKLPASATDQEVNLGTLSEASILFILCKNEDISAKFVPTGAVVGDALALPLTKDVPTILGASIEKLYLSNAGITDAIIVVGSAGN